MEGKCEADCNLLPVFLVIFFFAMLVVTTPSVPFLSVTLRSVPDEQRSFAVSLQWIIVRCLGFIPGPIIFGAVIDKACLFWKESCDDETGACYYYDNRDLSNYVLALALSCRGVSIILFVLSLVLYKPPHATDIVQVVRPTSDPAVSNPSFHAH